MKATCFKCGRVVTLTAAAKVVVTKWDKAVLRVWYAEGDARIATPEVLRRHKCDHGVWCISCLQQHKARGAA